MKAKTKKVVGTFLPASQTNWTKEELKQLKKSGKVSAKGATEKKDKSKKK